MDVHLCYFSQLWETQSNIKSNKPMACEWSLFTFSPTFESHLSTASWPWGPVPSLLDRCSSYSQKQSLKYEIWIWAHEIEHFFFPLASRPWHPRDPLQHKVKWPHQATLHRLPAWLAGTVTACPILALSRNLRRYDRQCNTCYSYSAE